MDLYNLIISAKLSKGEGGDVSVDPLSVTENGTYTASSGHAYSPVTVNVPQPSGTKNITTNGTHDVAAYASANVNVPSVTPTGNINITSTAQTDVSAYATAQVVDSDLVAGNIKKDVNILGVTGTYEGGGGGGDDSLKKVIERTVTNLVVPDGTTMIGKSAFAQCPNLASITVPDSVKTLEQYAFNSCTALINFEAMGVTRVNGGAFYYANKLESVKFGPNLANWYDGVFNNCSSLKSLTILAPNPPSYMGNPLNGCPSDVNIYVPAASVEAYKSNGAFSSRAAYIQAIPE